MRLQSSTICLELQERLETQTQFVGSLHSVFDSSCNLLVPGRDGRDELVTLLSAKRPMAKNAVRIDGELSFRRLFNRLNLQIGDRVILSSGALYMDARDQALEVNLQQAGSWDPKPALPKAVIGFDRLNWLLELLKRFLRTNEQGYGIVTVLTRLVKRFPDLVGLLPEDVEERAELSFVEDRLENYLDAYIHALRGDKTGDLSQLAGKIIGFGQGLTPSMDDFLSGLMVTILYGAGLIGCKATQVVNVNVATTRNNGEKTTIVSAEMLRHAAIGQVNEFLRDIMVFMFDPESRTVHEKQDETFKDLLEKEKSIGASSGLDTLYGVLVGCCICKILKEER